jgi:TolB-like protein
LSFFAELRRRNVIRMAGLYLVGAWVVVQVAETLLPAFDVPAWVLRAIIIVTALGFLPALVFAWIFEITPEGIKRDVEVDRTRSIAPQTGQRMNVMIAVLLALALVYFAIDKFVFGPTRDAINVAASLKSSEPDAASAAPAIDTKSIAVLPFENLSEEKANAFFADGIQDQILTGLSKIGALKVISRTSTQQYASTPTNLSEIARQLGVAHVLEGSVQKAGNRVRINVQLIEAETDSHLWAETYDRTLDDIFEVESEVAEKIASSLAATLSRGERDALSRKPTDNPKAFEAYLKARAFNSGMANRAQYADILAAYREAVTLDPNFALAWAEYARHAILAFWIGYDDSGDYLREARTALEKATTLAPDLPQVGKARAVFLYYGVRDFAAALEAINQVKKTLPGDADVWMLAGYLDRRLGLWKQSLSDMQHSRTLAPNDEFLSYSLALSWLQVGNCEQVGLVLVAPFTRLPNFQDQIAVKLQCVWSTANLDEADRVLTSASADAPQVIALRGLQALFRRDYAGASALLAKAVASDSDVQSDIMMNGYIPSRFEWMLRQALSEQSAGNSAKAQALYAQVKKVATQTLAVANLNRNVRDSWQVALGWALAGLGQADQAVAQVKLTVTSVSETVDTVDGPIWQDYLAMIYAMNGDADHAVPLLDHQLQTTGSQLASGLLKLDPVFDPIRENPAFQALMTKYPTPLSRLPESLTHE